MNRAFPLREHLAVAKRLESGQELVCCYCPGTNCPMLPQAGERLQFRIQRKTATCFHVPALFFGITNLQDWSRIRPPLLASSQLLLFLLFDDFFLNVGRNLSVSRQFHGEFPAPASNCGIRGITKGFSQRHFGLDHLTCSLMSLLVMIPRPNHITDDSPWKSWGTQFRCS